MTMLNMLLYLLLLLAGSAVALVLADLHQAEESACQALAALDQDPEAALMPPPAGFWRPSASAGQPVAARSTAGQPAARRGQVAFITLESLPAPAAAADSTRDFCPSFDFARASAQRTAAQQNGPAVSGQSVHNDRQDWNCCA